MMRAMAPIVVPLLIALGVIAWWIVDTANHQQDRFDACWAKGGIQVQTVKFNNGTACVSRRALLGS